MVIAVVILEVRYGFCCIIGLDICDCCNCYRSGCGARIPCMVLWVWRLVVVAGVVIAVMEFIL